MKKVLMVIAPETFRDEEYAHPKEVLESRGARVVTASTRPGTCVGKLGMTAEAEISVAEADALDYDAVVFVGGAGSKVFFDDPYAQALARAARVNKRVLARSVWHRRSSPERACFAAGRQPPSKARRKTSRPTARSGPESP
jgi:protease I